MYSIIAWVEGGEAFYLYCRVFTVGRAFFFRLLWIIVVCIVIDREILGSSRFVDPRISLLVVTGV